MIFIAKQLTTQKLRNVSALDVTQNILGCREGTGKFDSLINISGKLAYDVGTMVRGVTSSFIIGWLNKHSDLLKKDEESYDKKND